MQVLLCLTSPSLLLEALEELASFAVLSLDYVSVYHTFPAPNDVLLFDEDDAASVCFGDDMVGESVDVLVVGYHICHHELDHVPDRESVDQSIVN